MQGDSAVEIRAENPSPVEDEKKRLEAEAEKLLQEEEAERREEEEEEEREQVMEEEAEEMERRLLQEKAQRHEVEEGDRQKVEAKPEATSQPTGESDDEVTIEEVDEQGNVIAPKETQPAVPKANSEVVAETKPEVPETKPEVPETKPEVPDTKAEPTVPMVVVPAEIVDTETEAESKELASWEESMKALEWEWEQSESSVEIKVTAKPAPGTKITGKGVKVDIKKDRLSIKLFNSMLLPETNLYGQVVVLGDDEAQWHMEDGKEAGSKVITIELPKAAPETWTYVFEKPVPLTGSHFLTSEEIASMWQKEVDEKEADEKMGLDGILLNVADVAETDKDKKETGEGLFNKAVSLLQGGVKAEEAVRMLKVSALVKKYAKAFHLLTEVYAGETPMGVPKDSALGVWFLWYAARTLQDVPALLTLARFYELGMHGLPASAAMAIKYYQKAARKGHTTAMSHFGELLMRGCTVGQARARNDARSRPDMAQALVQFGLSRGCAQSHYTLGNWLLKGEKGIPQDLDKAEAQYDIAKKLYPDLRHMIPTKELQELRKIQEVMAQALESGPVKSTEEMAAAVAEPKAVPTAKESTESKALTPAKKLDQKIMQIKQNAGTAAATSAATTEVVPMFGPQFWEKTGTVILGCTLVYYLWSLGRAH